MNGGWLLNVTKWDEIAYSGAENINIYELPINKAWITLMYIKFSCYESKKLFLDRVFQKITLKDRLFLYQITRDCLPKVGSLAFVTNDKTWKNSIKAVFDNPPFIIIMSIKERLNMLSHFVKVRRNDGETTSS